MIFLPSVGSRLTVSGWLTNWYDADGSVFGSPDLNTPKIIGNAREGIDWWRLDDDCNLHEELWYECDAISKASGKRRGTASFTIYYDQDERDRVEGEVICSNGNAEIDCPKIGFVSHLGYGGFDTGLPLTPNAVVTGATGGLGWLTVFDAGTPASMQLRTAQIDEDDIVMLALPYPEGTTFSITYEAASWCNPAWGRVCTHEFKAANSPQEVRNGHGDLYYFDENLGLLFLRYVQQRTETLDFSNPPAFGTLSTAYYEREVRLAVHASSTPITPLSPSQFSFATGYQIASHYVGRRHQHQRRLSS